MTTPSLVRRELAQLVTAVARGRVAEPVQRCILRIESPLVGGSWSGAEGVAEPATGSPLSDDAAFRAASVTKAVTACAVLALCDRGRCELGDPIGRYLPAGLVERVHVLDGHVYGPDITLRQLLDHTSGLRDFFGTAAIQTAIRHGEGRRRFAPADLLDLAVAAGPPTFPPGTGRSYTDTGFVLAGLVVEHLTRQPLDVAYRQLVLTPAGMHDTWLESSADPPRTSSISHHFLDGQDITGMDPTVDWAGGGLVTTAADLAGLVRAFRDGTLVSTDAWRAMTRWAPGPTTHYDHYGLGLGRYRISGTDFIGHHGFWGAFAFWAPSFDTLVTGTVNTAPVDRRPILAAVREVLTGGE